MGRTYNKNERRKDPKEGSKRKLPYYKTSGKTKNQMGRCGSEGSLRLLGIRGWRRRAENRDEWRCLMREAKAQKGL
jgi:ribosome assembly protein YihI (activator of Der GTPase)